MSRIFKIGSKGYKPGRFSKVNIFGDINTNTNPYGHYIFKDLAKILESNLITDIEALSIASMCCRASTTVDCMTEVRTALFIINKKREQAAAAADQCEYRRVMLAKSQLYTKSEIVKVECNFTKYVKAAFENTTTKKGFTALFNEKNPEAKYHFDLKYALLLYRQSSDKLRIVSVGQKDTCKETRYTRELDYKYLLKKWCVVRYIAEHKLNEANFDELKTK